MKTSLLLGALLAGLCASAQTAAPVYIATDAYKWQGDTIFQDEYMAFAPSDTEILSTYAAQPGYFMPVEKQWKLKNDISSYPQLHSDNRLHNAIYNMGLDEMVNAVEPDTTLRTGKEWAGVWTRDVSYSIILSMSYLQPEASRISLMKKVNPNGRIIQDTGSGGAWPVSSDRMIWAVAAWELYKVTGDRDWLEYIYPVIKNSIDDDLNVTFVGEGVNGEASFIDWREQSHPRWMQTVDIYSSQAQSTGAVHVAALRVLSDVARELGHNDEAVKYGKIAEELRQGLDNMFWDADKGYYTMYTYGRDFPIVNPRSETLGQSFAILYDVTSPEKAASITQNVPVTPYGPGIFYPQISDMPPYHNNALWPFVASYWTLANAAAGNEQGTMEGIGSVYRPAALFATNKENFVLDNGDIATELNSSNMLWSLSGNLAITHRVLFGIHFEPNALVIKPFVPEALAATRSLDGFKYRDAMLNITVNGYGDHVASATVNGKAVSLPVTIPANATGTLDINIQMANQPIAPMAVNHRANLKAPLTPIARVEGDFLRWNPIEYIDHYIVIRDGKPVAETRATAYPVKGVEAEWMVVGVNDDGTQSFASEPMNTRKLIEVKPASLSTVMTSEEVAYQPAEPIYGYTGEGFFETDHVANVATFDVKIGEAGEYAMQLCYANGNGPVNTENKCAIRSILIDGKKVGTFVMPHRGVANWYDWGMTNVVKAHLAKGKHTITVEFLPFDENMNLATNHALIDRLVLRKL